MLADIRSLLKNHPNVTHVEFWDDNFFVHLKRAKDIAEGIRRLDPRITWSVLGTHVHDVTRMDDDYLACLKRSGLKEVLTGVESGSQRIIEVIKKNFKMEELFLSNKRLANFGIRPTYSFISGIPGERDEDIKATIDTMFRLKEENPNILVGNIKPFICYPGTALYERAMKLGFKSPESLEGWSKFVWGNYFSLNIPWMPLRRKRTLAWLYYYTVLMNPEYMFIHSKIFTVIAKILRPVAEWRVRKMCFRFPVEAWVMNLVQSLVL
ncbi:MAG: hypothetical protein A2987_01850 [Omnitrophica bacterium RIFCSPLOWO2_01_FULL_45_10]|nr:MAG: hypothetical protein A2987_01850 [Omnitrophica bacterium RIFCSPLOWO2_01_FULL_45_10]